MSTSTSAPTSATRPATTATIAAALERQFDRLFSTLRDAIDHFDDQGFIHGVNQYVVPSNLAFHLVEAVDYYCSDCVAGRFAWGAFLEGRRTPLSRQDALTYLEQVEQKLHGWLRTRSDADWLAAQDILQGTGPTVLDRAIYSLRHAQHHLGQINSELRHRNLPRGKWQ